MKLIVSELTVRGWNGAFVAHDLGSIVILDIGKRLLVILVTFTEEVMHVRKHKHSMSVHEHELDKGPHISLKLFKVLTVEDLD